MAKEKDTWTAAVERESKREHDKVLGDPPNLELRETEANAPVATCTEWNPFVLLRGVSIEMGRWVRRITDGAVGTDEPFWVELVGIFPLIWVTAVDRRRDADLISRWDHVPKHQRR